MVVDTQNIEVSSQVEKGCEPNSFVSSVRLGTTGVDGVRVVFDLQKPAIVKKAFMLAPQSKFSWRFVIDLEVTSEREFAAHVGNDHAFSNDSYDSNKTSVKNVSFKLVRIKEQLKKMSNV